MTATQAKSTEFSAFRSAVWPIHAYELKKFLPMGLIMFFILFNYTVLRDTKDTLVATAPGGGIELIPFLKSWCVLPSAVLFVVLYSKLVNVFSQEKLFYIIVGTFLVFFGSFAFLIYPNQEFLHPSVDLITSLQAKYPRLQWVFPIWGSWSYSLFYIFSELWGSVMISLLFWQYANEVTRTYEAKRFYAMFGLLANFALMASGMVVHHFSDIRKSLPADVDPWGYSLSYLMSAVVICGLLAMVIYRWMQTNILTDKRFYDAAVDKGTPKKKKPKLSVKESFSYLLKSPYIGLIALLVLSYGISINLVELVWKKQLQFQFPDPNDYNGFMGKFSFTTGLVTILLILLTKGIVGKFGWFKGAVLPPIVLGVTGAMFFIFVLFGDWMAPLVALSGLTPLYLAVLIGAAQNILSKGTKYSLFDPTKEMAYIPLDQELKTKGKAAVDVIGGRLGKASGGYIAIALFVITGGSIQDIAPYLAGIVVLVLLTWIGGVRLLAKRYNALVHDEK